MLDRVRPDDRSTPSYGSSSVGKRSTVVADDAAFREKNKLLTIMERQNWLNSYMQRLQVLNTK